MSVNGMSASGLARGGLCNRVSSLDSTQHTTPQNDKVQQPFYHAIHTPLPKNVCSFLLEFSLLVTWSLAGVPGTIPTIFEQTREKKHFNASKIKFLINVKSF